MSSSPSKSKTRLVLIAIVSFLLAWLIMKQFLNAPSSKIGKIMTAAAKKVNSSCPLMVDSETRLDHVSIVGDKAFRYHYTLVNKTSANTDVSGMKNYLEPLLVRNVKNNPNLSIYREHDVTIAYYYYFRNGDLAMKIEVTPEKYRE
jgi:hypothetical protein